MDFEEGNLRGWEQKGEAFRFQPTFDDNPKYRDKNSNLQGRYWIGTYEKYQGLRGQKKGEIQGDVPTGTLTSAAFTIPSGTLSFLIGGGSSNSTYVAVFLLTGTEEFNEKEICRKSAGSNSETMNRVSCELTPYAGKTGKIRIVDASSGPWGHINVDDFRFLSGHEEQRIKVPDLVGHLLNEEIERIIIENRLRAGRIQEKPSDQKAGTIFRQEPEPGAMVKSGTPVHLWIAAKIESPIAKISPRYLRVVQGEKAAFESQSTPENEINESWRGPGGQTTKGRYFEVHTDKLDLRRYEIILEIEDNQRRSDRAVASLEVIGPFLPPPVRPEIPMPPEPPGGSPPTLPEIPWKWIIPGILAGFGGGYLLKKSLPRKVPVVYKRPQKDPGTQQIESYTSIRPDFEVRLRPILDRGNQDIEQEGSLLVDERRQDE